MSRRARAIAGWVALAVAGLVVAVAVSYTASRLVAQDVGLPGERGLSDAALVPAPTPRTATEPAATLPQTTARPASGSQDDRSGDGGERGGGGGYGEGDDD